MRGATRSSVGASVGATAGSVVGMAAAVLVCVAAVLLASGLGPVVVTGDGPLDRWRLSGEGPPAEAPEAGEDAVADVAQPGEPAGGIPAEVVLAMAVALVAAALLVRAVLQARRPEDEDEHEEDGDPVGGDPVLDLDSVARAARRGLQRLDQVGGDGAADAVVACWVELEAAAGRLGSGRGVTDTPTDFAARLSAAAPALDAGVLAELRRTYSRARFGAGASEDDVRRARAALAHLLDTLAPAGARLGGHG